MGRKRMYAKWDVAAREIEDVLRNELKVKGLKSVELVYDRAGFLNSIGVFIDKTVRDNGVVWDKKCIEEGYADWSSHDFVEKLRNYLNEKDKSILACKDYSDGTVYEKYLTVTSGDWD